MLVSLHHKSPTGLVDHFAIGVEGFNRDALTRGLNQRGANPENNLDAEFHIKDPEGIRIQIVAASLENCSGGLGTDSARFRHPRGPLS